MCEINVTSSRCAELRAQTPRIACGMPRSPARRSAIAMKPEPSVAIQSAQPAAVKVAHAHSRLRPVACHGDHGSADPHGFTGRRRSVERPGVEGDVELAVRLEVALRLPLAKRDAIGVDASDRQASACPRLAWRVARRRPNLSVEARPNSWPRYSATLL